MKVQIKILPSWLGEAREPDKAFETDAGWDLASPRRMILPAKSITVVPTGLCICCPPDHFYRLENRSSMMGRGLYVEPAIIDASYTGHIKPVIHNTTNEDQVVEQFDRIAQAVFYHVIPIEFKVLTDEDWTHSLRGEAGFGSSGA